MKLFREDVTNARKASNSFVSGERIARGEGVSCFIKNGNIGYITKEELLQFVNGAMTVNNSIVKYKKAVSAVCECDVKFSFEIDLQDGFFDNKGVTYELTQADLFTFCYSHNAKCVIENNKAKITTCFYNHFYGLNDTNTTKKNGFFSNLCKYGNVTKCVGYMVKHDNHMQLLKCFNGRFEDIVKLMQAENEKRGFEFAKITDREDIINFG